MNAGSEMPPPLPTPLPSTEQVLRKLYLTLFLRGRSARGLQKQGAPKSIASRLGLALVMYALIGFMVSLGFIHQPVFSLSLYLHGMTFVFLGMFVASSAGEVLFNKEEADILMHRPIPSRALLWAKISVIVQVSLWLAGAFNLAGFIVGGWGTRGGWVYVVAHLVSTVLQALFCTGSVVVVYQLCLRWFGREKLDGLMTTAQVFVAVAAVGAGQIVPRLFVPSGRGLTAHVDSSWWIGLLPPAWFAGFDDALAGRGSASSWELAGLGVTITAVVLWLAFGKLVRDYETGLQTLNEAAPMRPQKRTQRRWLDRLVHLPPLSWWLRNSVERASFLLIAAYLVRDRDTKLRIYPGIAPMLVMPLVMLLQQRNSPFSGGFGVAFTAGYLGLIPLLAMDLLRYSQHWQAADIFRVAPMTGPAHLSHGVRRAVLLFLTMPAFIFFLALTILLKGVGEELWLALPGILVLPLYSLIPCLSGKAVPLSMPTEEVKSTRRGLVMFGIMLGSLALSGLAMVAWNFGWFKWFMLVEIICVAIAYVIMRVGINQVEWESWE